MHFNNINSGPPLPYASKNLQKNHAINFCLPSFLRPMSKIIRLIAS